MGAAVYQFPLFPSTDPQHLGNSMTGAPGQDEGTVAGWAGESHKVWEEPAGEKRQLPPIG